MKEGWEVKKLPQISENLDSRRIPITQNKRSKGKFPYYGASGIVDYVSEYLFDEDLLLISEDGANLLARTYPIAFSVTGKIWVNNHAHVLKFSNIYTQRFVEYYFSFIKLDDYVTGMAQPKLNQKALNSIDIPIPPLSEQQRIVEILDDDFAKIDTVKQNAERNRDNAKELFQSILKYEISYDKKWELKILPQISENLDAKRVPITQNKRESGEYPYYGASGIVDYLSNYIFDDNLLLVSEDGANLLARTYPIAFSVSGKLWVNNHAHVLKFKDIITQRFIEYFFASIKIDRFVSGMAQPKLNQKSLNSIPIPYPSLSEQQQIVSKLDALSEKCKELENNYQQTINDCDELKKAILAKAFNGEL